MTDAKISEMASKATNKNRSLVSKFLADMGRANICPEPLFDEACKMMLCLFADWQKEQMLKNPIEGVVTLDYWDDKDREVDVILADDVIAEEHGIKDGDKVKLIIIKED